MRLRIPENLRGMIRDKFVACQDKFRIKAVRRRFVNCLSGKISLQSIFKIVVEPGLLACRSGASIFCSFIITSLALLHG